MRAGLVCRACRNVFGGGGKDEERGEVSWVVRAPQILTPPTPNPNTTQHQTHPNTRQTDVDPDWALRWAPGDAVAELRARLEAEAAAAGDPSALEARRSRRYPLEPFGLSPRRPTWRVEAGVCSESLALETALSCGLVSRYRLFCCLLVFVAAACLLVLLRRVCLFCR